MKIWTDRSLRQTGRTHRMLLKAMEAVFADENVVIVGRDDHHADALKSKFTEMCMWDSTAHVQKTAKDGHLIDAKKAADRAVFLTIHSLTSGYRDAWVFVDHWAQEALVERWWMRGGT